MTKAPAAIGQNQSRDRKGASGFRTPAPTASAALKPSTLPLSPSKGRMAARPLLAALRSPFDRLRTNEGVVIPAHEPSIHVTAADLDDNQSRDRQGASGRRPQRRPRPATLADVDSSPLPSQ